MKFVLPTSPLSEDRLSDTVESEPMLRVPEIEKLVPAFVSREPTLASGIGRNEFICRFLDPQPLPLASHVLKIRVELRHV